MSAKLPEGYETPTTTNHAYRFGFMAGRGGYARVSHAEFMSAQIVEHLYPHSLYRAYRRGFAEGRKLRAKRLADDVAAQSDHNPDHERNDRQPAE